MANNKQVINDSIWSERIKAADRYYSQWETRFMCDILDEYYEGKQWKSQDTLSPKPYVINKVFETIQIKIANFIPTFPQFLVSSKVGNEDDLSAASNSSHLKEDVLNTIIQDPEGNFSDECEQAYKDSFFRFAIMEVGYEADWIWNPNVPKPLLGKDTEQNLNSKERQRVIDEPPEIPVNERVYVKHIPAKSFRIGGNDHKYLSRCGWCGYYEYVNKDELLALPKLMNRDKIFSAPGSDEPNRESNALNTEEQKRGSVKIWKIWDLKSRMQLLILDSPCVTVFQKKFKRLPLFDYRPDKRLVVAGFYPIPPAYHWISPQDEYNEIRDQLRNHRRRFIRKYQMDEGMIDDEEIQKFETGPDGAIIKVKPGSQGIRPVENADLGNVINETLATSADDLNRISGTTDESRGVADRTTATQANIVNQRTALRETKERDRIVRWLISVGREILLTVKDRFTGKILARLTSPEGEPFAGTVQEHQPVFRFVEHEDINDGYDFRINVDLTSMSSTAQIEEKQHLVEYLTMLTQFPMVAFSPYLVREIAYRVGYRNEKAIAEFQKMALLMELGRMQQLQGALQPQPQQGQPGPGGMPQNGNAGQQIAAQMAPPNAEQMRNQLQNQLGQTQG